MTLKQVMQDNLPHLGTVFTNFLIRGYTSLLLEGEGRLNMVCNKQMKQKVHQRYKTVPEASTVV